MGPNRTSPGNTRLSGLVCLLVLSGACSPHPPGSEARPSSPWLAATGFQQRASWNSAVLHLRRGEFAREARVSSILSRVPELRIQPRPVHGWGVEQVRTQAGDTCAVHVFLNGDEVRPNLADRQILHVNTLVPTRLLDGLELHFGSEGPTYEEDGCASLLLWSEALRSREDRPFRGSLRGMVRSRSPDTVTQVVLEPVHQVRKPSGVGLFRFDSLPPGAYKVMFAGPDGPVAQQDVRVYAHRESSVELSVVSGGRVFATPRTVVYREAGLVGNGNRRREVP